MKTFAELKQRIFESGEHTFGGGFGDTHYHDGARSAFKDYGSGTFELEKDDNLGRVNAFLNSFFKREFVDYKQQLGTLKTKLNLIGLDFVYDKNTQLREGMNTFPVNRWGGTFGKYIDTPFDEFEKTNGFEEGVDYNLNMSVEKGNNGLYRINAEIVRQANGLGAS